MIKNVTDALLATTAASILYDDVEHANLHDEDTIGLIWNDKTFLKLRYYARHFIPVFCVVGILGNCMALMLIRYELNCCIFLVKNVILFVFPKFIAMSHFCLHFFCNFKN